jgi:GNAT superfamily N-acetyltransferase
MPEQNPRGPLPAPTFVRAGPALSGQVLELVAAYYAFDGISLDAQVARGLEALLAEPALGGAWLVQIGGATVGYFVLTFGFDLEFGGRVATLTELFLLQAARGQGVGRAVIAQIEALLRELGIAAYELQVERTNSGARAFYRRMGFEAHDRLPMSKRLGRGSAAGAAEGLGLERSRASALPAPGVDRFAPSRSSALRLAHLASVPEAWRSRRLDRLAEPQELFVEGLVAKGTGHLLHRGSDGGGPLGYAVVGDDGCLLELGLADGAEGRGAEAMRVLRAEAGVRAILAQSFDPTLMSLGLRFGRPPETESLLFRRVWDATFEPRADVVAAPGATAEEVLELAALGADFFEGVAEVEAYRASGNLMVYRDPSGTLLGAGILRRAIPARAEVDLGMVVRRTHRRRGLGTHIVRHLKALCLSRGWRPVCGCGVENVASQLTLERAGFAPLHALLRFRLAG